MTESNANNIIPSYCHLSVSCRSIVDRCGSLGSCKPHIIIINFFTVSLAEWSVCLTTGHEVEGSIPGTSVFEIFFREFVLERGSVILVCLIRVQLD